VVTKKGVSVDVLPPEQVIHLSSVAPFAFEELYAELAKRRIQSLWLEGGAQLHTLFLESRQVQRLVLYLAPMILGQGRPLFDFPLPALKEAVRLSQLQLTQMGDDLRITAHL
jgi:diaminohydroxyphosphoribosylaminopyrimidine deaminase/5-amino-6-(5-phosphoribosylamino)uracil reductase